MQASGGRRPYVVRSLPVNIFSEVVRLILFIFQLIASREQIIVFCSGRIRTVVAMASHSSHRLLMEKWKLIIVCVSIKIFGCFKKECLLSFPLRFIRLLPKLNSVGCRVKFRQNVKKKFSPQKR